ncbi:hypothetical protein PINS_up002253 [Pythium insidiosum]|nr:hypothetical protein PINS_up002253 [Pythium insidiosum]
MLNHTRSSLLPTFQRLQASMREFDQLPNGLNMGLANNHHHTGAAASVPNMLNNAGPAAAAISFTSPASSCGNNNWREATDELRRTRSQVVVLIERMLRNHSPHDVLTQVPENNNWRSKTFVLALKIERLMFLAAPTRENYLNEQTLRSRVQLLSRHLVRIRKRKNAIATLLTPNTA